MLAMITDVFLVSMLLHFGTRVTCQESKDISINSCSFCHSNLSVSFVAHLMNYLPKGVIPILIFDNGCTDQVSSSIVEEIYVTSKGILLQSITFQSSDEIDSAVTRLQEVILTMSKRTQEIYVFCVCLLHPELVPLIDKMFYKFPWVRWVLLTVDNDHSYTSDPSLFQRYPVSACKIALSYEESLANAYCTSRRCKKTETNFIIDGPDIENNNCSQRIQIGKWISKRRKLLPGKSNDFFRFTKRPHFSGREITVASVHTFPFFAHEYDSNGNLHVKEGIDLKMIQAFAQKFNFRLRHVPSIDNKFGAKLPNGSWNGLIGMIQRQEAEIAVSDIGMSNSRSEVIDFTYPYVNDQINFLIQAPREKPRALAIIRPFSLELRCFMLRKLHIINIHQLCDRIHDVEIAIYAEITT
ncbi:uncharacterized protein LOC111086069 [Limulus polyphemus]|uniref:Uncharacterized protein LOC111086069 n=1 Tax=Limulus polyphemus TaxID=6850 RepID=A0ABM1SHT9_LIMPO|nr:uncharacterized protein LOC111086069 [Limulus polyphemus]